MIAIITMCVGAATNLVICSTVQIYYYYKAAPAENKKYLQMKFEI
jgi:hypothetical protein